jgi:hypothetical protein
MALSSCRGQATLELILASIFVLTAFVMFSKFAKSADHQLARARFSTKEITTWKK